MFDQYGSRKYLSDTERNAFFGVVQGDTDERKRAFCLTLFYTGCRISEALNLTVGRIDISQKHVIFETLKRRKRGIFRSVPIPDNLAVLFAKIVKEADASKKVWSFSRPTAYRMIKGFINQANIAGVMASPKGLRHGFAVACIAKDIPLPTIQKWLGHARLETTAIYLSVSGDEERNLACRLWNDEK